LPYMGMAGIVFSQTPPPKPAPANQPTVTLSVDDPQSKVMPAVPPGRAVITIGDIRITAAEFDQMIDALPENYRGVARGAGRKQFADNLVRILVLAEEGRRRKIDESSSFKTQAMFSAANLLAGLTADDVRKNVKLDDAELHRYYDEHKLEHERVRARHILVRMQGSPLPVTPGQRDLTEAEALAKAREIRQKIQDGGDFASLAGTDSDDSESSSNGGDLGFFRRGQRVPSFEEAAFALKVAELSQPVKSPFGYHIIRVEAREFKTFEEMRPEMEKKMRPELAQKTVEELAAKAGAVLDPEFFGIAKQ